ncbi:ribonuclease Z [Candidatus Micrarchaeota archaeon]|nr:ribonuclease Z [Candidatus Micrarchaeota archaeon]MBU1166518.1 ribonuclease Z [Candidatus Micrarchaeota archaeon]MBU1887530.1 ribonuclease Z [Candidatus Micrarchaeota archaeon]
MLKLTFLGTSGSTPTIERGMPSIALKYDRELMLFDCGEGTQRQLMKYKVGYGSVDSIFISHPHLDHYLGMYGLLETLRLSSPSPRPLNLFLPRNVEPRDYSFIKTHGIRKGVVYKGTGFSISAFPVKHCNSAYGFVFQEDDRLKFDEKKAHGLGLKGRMFAEIQKKGQVKTPGGIVNIDEITWTKPGIKIVYGGDCTPDAVSMEAAKNADILIHEATFDSSLKEEAKERLHSTVEDAALVAKEVNVKQLILTHISPRYSDISDLLASARNIFDNTIIAQDGLVIEVK